MLRGRSFGFAPVLAIAGIANACLAQTTTAPAANSDSQMWRPANTKSESTATTAANSAAPRTLQENTSSPSLAPVAHTPRQSIAKVTSGTSSLPNEDGQVWREYDISPYTVRVTSTNRPEQAIVDWILRETGYEAWHTEPLAILSANKRVLRVYHTPQMQQVVSEIVDRFVNSEAESQAFGLRIISLANPNWRAKAVSVLRPIPVQTQGIQAWLVAKEDAALLIGDMRKRSDFREHGSPHLLVNNGQSTVVAATRPRNYIREVLTRANAWPGFEPQVGQILEGFSLELNPLVSIDGTTVDAVIKCNIDHVDELLPVVLDVPTPAAPRQRTQMDVPQILSTRLHERFRWPKDQVLLISLGMVPAPMPVDPSPLRLPLMGDPDRTDLLLFVESKGSTTAPTAPDQQRTAQQTAPSYRGRY